MPKVSNSNISIAAINKNEEKEHRRIIATEEGYLWTLAIEANNIAVQLYEIAEFSTALELFLIITEIVSTSQSESFFNPCENVAENLQSKIASAKETLHLKDTSSEFTSSSVIMDLYFSPSSLCDGSAFLSEPVIISENISRNGQRNCGLDFMSILFNLALVYLQIGAVQKARDLLKNAKEILSKNYPTASEILSSVLNGLGCIFYRQEKIDSALELFHMANQVAQIGMQKIKQEQTEKSRCLLRCIGTSSSNIGRVCFLQKRYKEAASHCLNALQSRKGALGEEHLEVYATTYNLGLIKQQQEKFEEAMKLYEIILSKACASEVKVAIPNQDVVTVLINFLLIRCKSYGMGFEVMRRLKWLQTLRNKFGYEDYRIPEVLGCIGKLLFDLSLYPLALPFLLEQLRLEKIFLGNHHKELASTLYSIGQAYQKRHYLKEAIAYFTEVLLLFRCNEKEKILVVTMFNLGISHYQLGFYDKALLLYKKAIKMQKEILGEYHLDVADMLLNIGDVYFERGRVDEAMNSFIEALHIRRLVLGNDHPDVIALLHKIGQLLDLNGESQEALNVFYEILSAEKKTCSISIDVAVTLQNIAHIHHSLGNIEKAIEAFQEIISILSMLLGENHLAVASVLNALGILYSEIGMTYQSVSAYKESKKIMKKLKLSRKFEGDEMDFQLLIIFGKYSETDPPAAPAA